MATVTKPDAEAAALFVAADGSSYDSARIESAYGTEQTAQAAVCSVPPDDALEWPADLAEALYRRVARNLATGALPLGDAADKAAGEIKRLEGPYRKYPIA